MKTYFAHPVTDYDTPFEAECRAVLAQSFGDILDPNSPEHDAAYKTQGWPYFDALVESCQACAFVRMPDGRIGAGVAKEVETFFARGLPVFAISRGAPQLRRIYSMPFPVMTVEETRDSIRAIRAARLTA